MVENFGQDLAAAGVSIEQLDADTQKLAPLLQSIGRRVFEQWTKLFVNGVPGERIVESV